MTNETNEELSNEVEESQDDLVVNDPHPNTCLSCEG